VRRLAAAASLVLALTAASASAQVPPAGAQMPDAKQMSGTPLPVNDLPPGTVAVRVVRGSMANVISGHPVELLGLPSPRTVKTNETGRAEFSGLAVGTRVKAVTTVDGERLESQEFPVPAAGGVRVALVATDPEAAKRAAEDQRLAQTPAQPGLVVLGEQTRFVFELGDDGLNVFNILQIVNTARTPVQPPGPLVFDLPSDAVDASILEGSSSQATLAGKRVTVTGPFAPGTTLVQFAYAMPLSGSDLTIALKLPAALTAVAAAAQKVGETHMTSPQFAQHRDMTADGGQLYTVAQGPGLPAGETLVFNFTGLPHAPVWPRNLALALAVLVLAGGAWASLGGPAGRAGGDAARRALEARRDRLFNELTVIEEQHRRESIDPAYYTRRRRELVAALERLYAQLDEEAAA
jgi:hypothetical protein